MLSDENPVGRFQRTRGDLRLRPHSGGGCPRFCLEHAVHRRAVAGYIAPALCPPGLARTGGNGVPRPVVSARIGRVHRVSRSGLPHALLRRADPSPRPCPTVGRRWHDLREQRAQICERCNYVKEAADWAVEPGVDKNAGTQRISSRRRARRIGRERLRCRRRRQGWRSAR